MWKGFLFWYKRHSYLESKKKPIQWDEVRRTNKTYTVFVHQDSTASNDDIRSLDSSSDSSRSSKEEEEGRADSKLNEANLLHKQVNLKRSESVSSGAYSSSETHSEPSLETASSFNDKKSGFYSMSSFGSADMLPSIATETESDKMPSIPSMVTVADSPAVPVSRKSHALSVPFVPSFPPIPTEVGEMHTALNSDSGSVRVSSDDCSVSAGGSVMTYSISSEDASEEDTKVKVKGNVKDGSSDSSKMSNFSVPSDNFSE
jgi:hypothetical protein